MLLLRWLLPLLLAVPSFALAPQEETLEIRRLLVVDRLSAGRRSPIVHDPLEGRWCAGSLGAPVAGELERGADGEEHAWRVLEANEDGAFQDEALRGGWALATVELDEGGPWILEARGHSSVRVADRPRGGDPYDFGFVRLPVHLEAGSNRLLFEAGRGRLAARLVRPPSAQYLEGADPTLPDLVRGERDPLPVAVQVGNATREPAAGLRLVAHIEDGGWTETPLPTLEPLSVRRLGFLVAPPAELPGEKATVELSLRDPAGTELSGLSLELAVRDAGDAHVRSFFSALDGSVQLYAVRLPAPPEAGASPVAPGLVLSLHGAGVQPRNQAGSYAPKADLLVVAPTNRRPFGFDWEDWGRMDALEVLALAEARWRPDPRRIYLTGHSMGGHGTWTLGAHLAGSFAALAPSAGWSDFWSYGGKTPLDATDPVGRILDEAANASRTTLLQENYLQAGVYVLHGDQDRSVPVEEARAFRHRLGEFHPDFAYYERPGAGHWWGAACLDWPPLFDFLRAHELPAPGEERHVVFTTVNPSIHATCRWVTIHAQTASLLPSRVDVELVPAERELLLEAENVARLSLDLRPFSEARGEDEPQLAAGEPLTLFAGERSRELAWPADGVLRLARSEERTPDAASDAVGAASTWGAVEGHAPGGKSPLRAGPFKEAFRHRMLFVYGTAGDAATSDELRAAARFHAETFAYRGNGSIEVVPDTAFDPALQPDRDVILFGNAATCRAWSALLGDGPVRVAPGSLAIGGHELAGEELLAVFVRPRPGSDVASVAAFAPTGPSGPRMAATLPVFVSGVAYPDWTVLDLSAWSEGLPGVLGAGFFGPDWGVESGRSAWR